jgi:hypothetical protein
MRSLRTISAICLALLLSCIAYVFTRVDAQTSNCTTPTPASGKKWGGPKQIQVYIDPTLAYTASHQVDCPGPYCHTITAELTVSGLQAAAAGNWNALNGVGYTFTITQNPSQANIQILNKPSGAVDATGTSRLAVSRYTASPSDPNLILTGEIDINLQYRSPALNNNLQYDPSQYNFDASAATNAAGGMMIRVGAHEIGHVMGLDHPSDQASQVPGATVMNSSVGTNDIGNNVAFGPTDCDRSTLGRVYGVTPVLGGGGGGGGGGTTPPPTYPYPGNPPCWTLPGGCGTTGGSGGSSGGGGEA